MKVPANEKNLASLSILPLGEVELERYNTDRETSPSSYIWSAPINFSGSNGSAKRIVDNGNHNIATDTPLENASISTSSSISSHRECDLHQVHKTWKLTELPQSQKVILGRWVYKQKKDFVKLKTWVKHRYFIIVFGLAKRQRK